MRRLLRLLRDMRLYLRFPRRCYGCFRGVFATFEEAVSAAPKTKLLGYDDPRLAYCDSRKINGQVSELRETHRLRFLFKPERDLLLNESGLTPLLYREWIIDREPGFDTWAIYVVARG